MLHIHGVMGSQVIKNGALFLCIVLAIATSVDSAPDAGRKVVIVLPYYKHEVQAIYFKEPSPNEGPPNSENNGNPFPTGPTTIKVWEEKRPSYERAKGTGFPYSYSANSGEAFSGNTNNGNRGVTPSRPGNQAGWKESSGNSFGKFRNGDFKVPTDTISTSWSAIKVYPAHQAKQMNSNFNSQSTPWPPHNVRGGETSNGNNAQGWDGGWKSGPPQPEGSGPQSSTGNNLGLSQWQNQGGTYSPGGGSGQKPQEGGYFPGEDDGWKTGGTLTGSVSWQIQDSPSSVPGIGDGNGWAQAESGNANGQGLGVIPGGWETQTQEEWDKHQQDSNGNGYPPPAGTGNDYPPLDSVTWGDGNSVPADLNKWPTALGTASGWGTADEVNDGLSAGCLGGGNGNNCFRGENVIRVRNNHNDGFNSQKTPDGLIGNWDPAPLPNGERNFGVHSNNYQEISYNNGKGNEIYAQGENSYSGSGYETKGIQAKSVANDLNQPGFNNYRLRESRGASSTFAVGDNRSNRNGKHQLSKDAELFMGQDSYKVFINHGNSDFYKNSRKADVAVGGKQQTVDSYKAAARLGGFKTRVKPTELSGKEKNATLAVSEFGKKLKDGNKRLKKTAKSFEYTVIQR